MLITGDDKDGKVIHDAGHTVFNVGILIAVKRWSMTAS
ncbi:lipoprotein [Escherichia coli]|uniref:Lipoprotein n=1 Tax=Escherichia coli TaxID=562 RepID=A0A377BBX9_ECOLX|nr:lipoprotein [Escherichia coli]